MDIEPNVIPALILTLLAGLSTGIGSLIAYFIRKPKKSYLSFSLGFSAGVMVYISFMELLAGSVADIGELWGIGTFFMGILLIAAIDIAIPEVENPHEYRDPISKDEEEVNPALMRTGKLVALAIAIHNFPEGLATFGVALGSLNLGVVIAFAIAIHNIPEGISVSVPFFYATGDRKKAFLYSFLSGTAEPIGAIIGFLILSPFLNAFILSSLLAFVGGIMVYISFDELLPLAHDYGRNHIVISGIILGMFIMALSLSLL
ncbi:MAG: zinc transporter ZupT [Thermoplasmatota archaeon]